MTSEEITLLRYIASDAVSGVPGAMGKTNIGSLLIAGLVEFGVKPPVGITSYTYEHAWVKPSAAGLAWLEANPVSE